MRQAREHPSPNVTTPRAESDVVQSRLNERLVPNLKSLAWGASAALTALLALGIISRDAAITSLVFIDTTGAIICIVGALALHKRDLAPEHAHAAATVILLLVGAASLATAKLLHLAVATTNLLLVMVSAAALYYDLRWTAWFYALALASWIAVFLSEPIDDRWIAAAFSVGAAAIVGLAIQLARLRHARETEALLMQNEARAQKAESVAATEHDLNLHLRDAKESLEAFAHVVSHDLKEPVRATSIFLEEAKSATDGEERERFIDKAAISNQNMARLLEGLLEWSRAGLAQNDARPLDVLTLLQEPGVSVQWQHLLEEKGGTLTISRDIPNVTASAAILSQILGNLIVNSLKHNPKRAPTVRVLAGPPTNRGLVEIIVEDDGPGYPPAVLDSFTKLAQNPRTIKGGFGLAITRRAVERLGGQMTLATGPDGGARTHVYLPEALTEKKAALAKRVSELV